MIAPSIEHDLILEESASVVKIVAAMIAASLEYGAVTKNKANPAFKSTYADLAAVLDAVQEPLLRNGVLIMQAPGSLPDGRLAVITKLVHTSGEYFRSTLPMVPARNDPQGAGSAITYARRYALLAMVGVAPEDDDGNASVGKGPQRAQRPAPTAVDDAPANESPDRAARRKESARLREFSSRSDTHRAIVRDEVRRRFNGETIIPKEATAEQIAAIYQLAEQKIAVLPTVEPVDPNEIVYCADENCGAQLAPPNAVEPHTAECKVAHL